MKYYNNFYTQTVKIF